MRIYFVFMNTLNFMIHSSYHRKTPHECGEMHEYKFLQSALVVVVISVWWCSHFFTCPRRDSRNFFFIRNSNLTRPKQFFDNKFLSMKLLLSMSRQIQKHLAITIENLRQLFAKLFFMLLNRIFQTTT